MADGVWKGVYPQVFGRFKQLLLNKFLVAMKEEGGKNDENSGHYVIASSRLPERRPLERRTLVRIFLTLPPHCRRKSRYTVP